LLDWLRVEYGIEKPSNKLLALTNPDSNIWIRSKKLVRSEKACVSEGESPSSLEAKLLEFGTKVMNGKVQPTAQDRGLLGGRKTGGPLVQPGRTTVEKRTPG